MKETIRNTAIKMINADGLANLTRIELCDAVGVPNGSFKHVMGCGFVEFIDKLRAEGITGPDAKVTRKRVHPTIRRDLLLDAAVTVARRDGFNSMTRNSIAEQAGVSPPLVSRYLGTMKQLKRDVMRSAVQRSILPIVAQGLALGDPHAMKAPFDLRERAARSIAGAATC